MTAGGRKLTVDPGPPPATEPPEPATGEEAPGVESYPGPLLEESPPVELETVATLFVGLPLFALHLTLGRHGPDDAFVPTDSERREMARPVASMVNRNLRARAVVGRFGDPVAFVTLFGGYVLNETRRVADWRTGDHPPEGPPDQDLAGLGTSELREDGPPLRAWRPVVPPPEEDPNAPL